MHANILAHIALLSWVGVALLAFHVARPPVAAALVIIGAEMFLPAALSYDLPVIPPLDKQVIPALSALVACILFSWKSLARSRPGLGYDLIVLTLVVGAFLTTQTNQDPIVYGPTVLPGHRLYDSVSDTVKLIMFWWVSFYLGRSLFKSEQDLRALFRILAIGGVIYSLFIWVEMRMSPQMNVWFYGYHQSEFQQTLRGSGYRAKVFMNHGLAVALFMVLSAMAAIALAKTKQRLLGIPAGWVAVYLLLTVLACRSAGATIYVVIILPFLLFMSPKRQALVSGALALVLISYPLARVFGWVPVEELLDFFSGVFGEERAGSMAARFKTEDDLLGRAMERFWFGWGGYNRVAVYNPVTGKSQTTFDGLWLIAFGMRGVVGFLTIFGLILLPVWRLRNKLAVLPSRATRIYASCLGLMIVVYALDNIPNASAGSYLTFLVGVLAGIGPRYKLQAASAPAPAPLAEMVGNRVQSGRHVGDDQSAPDLP